MIIILKFLFLVILLGLSAFFSGSETAFFSLSRFDVQLSAVKRERGASRVSALLSQPNKLLITILIGNMIVNVWATTFITGAFLEVMGAGAVPVAVTVMTVLILIFGEITPKVIAVEHNSLWARCSAPLLLITGFVVAPLRWLLGGIRASILGREKRDDLQLGKVDIESALELAHREGAIEGKYKELLLHFLSLDRLTAEDVMIPRARIPLFDADSTMAELRRGFEELGSDVAIIMGAEGDRPRLLERRAAFLADENNRPWDIAIEAELIPVSKSIPELFFAERKKRTKRFVALDEHGDVAGVVEEEAVLLSVFGKPAKRDYPDLSAFSKIGDWFLIPAEIDLETFNDIFGSDFESKRYTTLGGFLVEKTGGIPSVGEEIGQGDLAIRVLKRDPRRLEMVAVKRGA